jgi:hypothetical protein
VAYSWRNPSLGYCQSMNFIAAVLLLYLPPSDAYEVRTPTILERWVLNVVSHTQVLARIAEDFLPNYYTTEMTGSLLDQVFLF